MDLLRDLDENYQEISIEKRFSCVVCLSPKFKMVYGLCQHKICLGCGYEADGSLKQGFYRCPTCQQENAFPPFQPSIPEDNITAQKLCGVRACKYEGCGQEVWVWEKSEHELFCPFRVSSPKCVPHHSVAGIKEKYRTVTPKPSSKRHHQTTTVTRSASHRESQHKYYPKEGSLSASYNFRNRSQRSSEHSHQRFSDLSTCALPNS